MDGQIFDDILLPLSDMPDEYFDSLLRQYQQSICEDDNDEYNNIDYNLLVRNLINDMSKKNLSEGEIAKISHEISGLYENNVRNNYYVLFSTIAEISKGNSESLDALNVNVDNLNEYAKQKYRNNEKVVMGFEKLNQYIKLEANRASYNQAQIEKLGAATEQFENQSRELESLEQRLKEYEIKLSTAESGYINNLLSVLGVFSGIIIAFFGGLEYITSVFNNIGDISRYRLVVVTLVVGFIVFNVVSIMMVFLGKMVDKDIYRSCKTPNCSCEKKCRFIKRLHNKLPYVYYVNFFMLWMLVGVVGLWLLDKTQFINL